VDFPRMADYDGITRSKGTERGIARFT